MPGVCPSRIIYEAERLNPNLPIRMRYCEVDTQLDSSAKIKKGERVVCLIGAANLDKGVFNEPFRFSLDPEKRKIEKYLLFNEQGNPRKCWGRDRVAMVVLRECLMAASRLQGLRKIAGKSRRSAKAFPCYGKFAGAIHPRCCFQSGCGVVGTIVHGIMPNC